MTREEADALGRIFAELLFSLSNLPAKQPAQSLDGILRDGSGKFRAHDATRSEPRARHRRGRPRSKTVEVILRPNDLSGSTADSGNTTLGKH
jgi:hypothetical protein